ncbi:MAG: hypothetical protein E7552_04555 [Ruminococcaceae bacterium]|nr:hypothetical protein [Oscillospiraceae bacterium]
MKGKLRIWRYAMCVTAVLLYITTYAVVRFVVPPYRAVALLAVLLCELFLRAPLKSAAATACISIVERGEVEGSYRDFRKAVGLQLWLWKTRLIRYALAFFPSVCLAALSDRIRTAAAVSYNASVLSAVIALLSDICLVVGIFIVEFSMLHYMSSWYVLSRFSKFKDAIHCSKQIALYRTEEVAELCLHTPPLTFSVARAEWISRQLLCSKHTYISFKNTKTVSGTSDA